MIKRLALSSVVLISLTAYSINSSNLEYPNVYCGLDSQTRFMRFKKGFGHNLLHNSFPQSNIYVGLRISEYFAIEAGYEETFGKSRISILDVGEVSAGMPVLAILAPLSFRSKIKVQGPHIDLLYFYPFSDRFEIFGSAGISFLKAASTRETLFLYGYIPRFFTRTMVARKNVLRLSVGIQYEFFDHFWIRGTVGWVGTNRIILYQSDDIWGIYPPQIKLRSSKFVGIGLLWRF